MGKPYTIRLFVPEGEPNTFKIIDKMNWTGIGLEMSRDAWQRYRKRTEVNQAGVYILFGYEEADEIPTLYIGQGDCVRVRIDNHEKSKSFWDKALVFTSSSGGLNRAHITWLEWALIDKVKQAGRCNIDNENSPSEPTLTESEKADTQEFLNEILSILPLVGIRVFEKAHKIQVLSEKKHTSTHEQDTIVVPAQEDGFQEVFIGENCWYAIRIGGGRLKKIRYIAVYRTAPVSAVTHYAEVESIEPYGDGGKYKLNFRSPASSIEPLVAGDAKPGTMQSSRYTTYEKLMSAKKLMDLFN